MTLQRFAGVNLDYIDYLGEAFEQYLAWACEVYSIPQFLCLNGWFSIIYLKKGNQTLEQISEKQIIFLIMASPSQLLNISAYC